MEAAQLGTVALWAAVAASAAALFYRPRATLRLAAVFAALATVVLAVALLTHDFSREYVAKTTSRATPWPYRISAVWGGMEGSMLFYVAVLLGIGAWGCASGASWNIAWSPRSASPVSWRSHQHRIVWGQVRPTEEMSDQFWESSSDVRRSISAR